ncbi:hypothetical protein ACU4GR_03075 [Methylobacterium oryzae CBMB20]|nr:hypothetical protein [Methylobacterium mesophilicum]
MSYACRRAAKASTTRALVTADPGILKEGESDVALKTADAAVPRG